MIAFVFKGNKFDRLILALFNFIVTALTVLELAVQPTSQAAVTKRFTSNSNKGKKASLRSILFVRFIKGKL